MSEIKTVDVSTLEPFSEKDWEKFRFWLLDMLKVTNIEVTFEKKDKSIRVMNCTLQPDLLPKIEVKENHKARQKTNFDVVSVFDLDKNGWRSFSIKAVKKIHMEIN